MNTDRWIIGKKKNDEDDAKAVCIAMGIIPLAYLCYVFRLGLFWFVFWIAAYIVVVFLFFLSWGIVSIYKNSETIVLCPKVKKILISKAKRAIRENKEYMGYLKHLPEEVMFSVTFQMAKACYSLSRTHENRQDQFQELIRLGEGVLSGTVQYEEYYKQANTLVDQIFEDSQPHKITLYLGFKSYTNDELHAATLFSGISLLEYKESCEKSRRTQERFENRHNIDKYLQFMSDALKEWALDTSEYSFSDWINYVRWIFNLKGKS